MRYFIGFRDGRPLAGNEGTHVTHYTAPHKLRETASNLKAMHKLDEVHLISSYTQTLCEMEADAFVRHVRSHGVKY